jgi:hypothetical protein
LEDRIAVENRAGLPDALFATMQDVLGAQTTLERALRWFPSLSSPAVPVDLIPQDEFSYDLLVRVDQQLYLSYDTS